MAIVITDTVAWGIVGVIALIIMAQYGRSARTEEDERPESVPFYRRVAMTFWMTAYSVYDVIESAVDLGWKTAALFGVASGALVWVLLPVVQLDPIAWATAGVFLISTGEVFDIFAHRPVIIGAVVAGVFVSLVAVKYYFFDTGDVGW